MISLTAVEFSVYLLGRPRRGSLPAPFESVRSPLVTPALALETG